MLRTYEWLYSSQNVSPLPAARLRRHARVVRPTVAAIDGSPP